MVKRSYIVGFEIQGHFVVTTNNPQAAAAKAIAIVQRHVESLQDDAEVEYHCPFGSIVKTEPEKDHG
jgi:hypothetical protein